MPLLYFLLMLVPLVLFHEFGHYLLARAMGVRVLSFSIGFGPVIAAWERQGTQYAVRALPLGGFVRMLGDDPSAPVDPEVAADPDAFTSKPVWRRALIVVAGPVFNFILPLIVLFGTAVAYRTEVESSVVGMVLPDGPAAKAGMLPGDRITSVGGTPVATFFDLTHTIGPRGGQVTEIVVDRDGQEKRFTLTPTKTHLDLIPEIGLERDVGKISVTPMWESSVVRVAPGSAAALAGVRSGDLVRALEVGGRKTTIERLHDLQHQVRAALQSGQSVAVHVSHLRWSGPAELPDARRGLETWHEEATTRAAITAGTAQDLEGLGLTSARTIVGFVEKGSPADTQAHLVPGDEIVTVDGKPLTSVDALGTELMRPYGATLRAHRGKPPAELRALLRETMLPHTLHVRRAQTAAEADVTLRVEIQGTKDERPTPRIGLGGAATETRGVKIHNPALISSALVWTRETFLESGEMVLRSLLGLFRGHVPVSELGGPGLIWQIANQTADMGPEPFLTTLSGLSINLGIMNLLPIPLVDGGHLLFLLIEAVRRGPVGLRTRLIASYVGMTFLGLLFLIVMKNDLQRLIR